MIRRAAGLLSRRGLVPCAVVVLLAWLPPAMAADGQPPPEASGWSSEQGAGLSALKAAVEETAQHLAKNPHLLENATRDIRSRVMTEFVEKGLPIAANKVGTWISEAGTNLAAAAGSASGGDWSAAQENFVHGLLTTGLSLGFGALGSAGGPVGTVAGATFGSYAGGKLQEFAHDKFWTYVQQGTAHFDEIGALETSTGNRLALAQRGCVAAARSLDRAEGRLAESVAIIGGVGDRLGAWEGVGLRAELAISRCERRGSGAAQGPSLSQVQQKIGATRSAISKLGAQLSGICVAPTGIPREEEIEADAHELSEAETLKSDAYTAAEEARNLAIDLQAGAGFSNQLIREAKQAAASSLEELQLARADTFEAQKLVPGARVVLVGPGGVNHILSDARTEIAACERVRTNLLQMNVPAISSGALYPYETRRALDEALANIQGMIAQARQLGGELEGLRARHEGAAQRVAELLNRIAGANRAMGGYDALIRRLAVCQGLETLDQTAIDTAVAEATALDPAGLERLLGEARVCIARNRGILDSCRSALAELDQGRALVVVAAAAVADANRRAEAVSRTVDSASRNAAALCGRAPAFEEIEALRAQLDQKLEAAARQTKSALGALAGICALRARYVTNPEILGLIEEDIAVAATGLEQAARSRAAVATQLGEIRTLAAKLRATNRQRDAAIDAAVKARAHITAAKADAEAAQHSLRSAGEELARTSPYLQAAMVYASCPKPALDHEAAGLRGEIDGVRSAIKLLRPEYALLAAESALSNLKACATAPKLALQATFAAAARLSTNTLDREIANATQCLEALKPLPPEAPTTSASAEGEGGDGRDSDDPLSGGIPTGDAGQVTQADQSGADFLQPPGGGAESGIGDTATGSGGVWGGGYGEDSTMAGAAPGTVAPDWQGAPGGQAPPRGTDVIATLGTSAGVGSGIFDSTDASAPEPAPAGAAVGAAAEAGPVSGEPEGSSDTASASMAPPPPQADGTGGGAQGAAGNSSAASSSPGDYVVYTVGKGCWGALRLRIGPRAEYEFSKSEEKALMQGGFADEKAANDWICSRFTARPFHYWCRPYPCLIGDQSYTCSTLQCDWKVLEEKTTEAVK